MIHDFLSFDIVAGKCEEWNRKHFYGRPRATGGTCGRMLPRWFKV